MRRGRTVLVFFQAMLMVGMSGCAPKDEIAPDVTISAPSEGAIFNVFDSVAVQFIATDETELVWASAKIVNADFVPVTASVQSNISGSPFSGYAEVVIDDKLLLTGDYHMLVTASDGHNEQLAYRKIRIIELPKKRLGVYFSDRSNAGFGKVFRTDSLLQNPTLFVDPSQDILQLRINSEKDHLDLIGHFSTGIRSYRLEDASERWADHTFPVAQTPRFMALGSSSKETFAALYDRELRAYSTAGSLTMNLQTGDFRPQLIYSDKDFLLVEMERVGDNDHFIFVYQAQSKALLWQVDVPIDVVAICPLQGDEVLLFGNDGDQARVLHYDMGSNGYWEPRQLPAGRVLDAVKMNGPTFAIAHANGLYSYTYSPNFLNLIRGGVAYQDICFDADNATIIGATQQILEEVTANGQLVRTVVHSDSITSIDIRYTR